MSLRWAENPAHPLVPVNDVGEEERERIAAATQKAKDLGVYQRASNVDRWHDATDNGVVSCGDIWQAAREGNLPRLEYLLTVEKEPVNKTRWSGITPLHRAAEEGQTEAAHLLLRHGANCDVRATWGWHTPLHLACGRGHEEVGRLLLKYGAEWKVYDKRNRSPLQWSIDGGREVMGRRLDHMCMIQESNEKKRNAQKLLHKKKTRQSHSTESAKKSEKDRVEAETAAAEAADK